MGLAEQIKAGATLNRVTTRFTSSAASTSGSVSLGSAYAVLSVQTDSSSSRVRLYDTLASLQDAAEISRVFGDTNVSASVSLIGDFSMSAAGTYTVDPTLYAVTETGGLTYFRAEPAAQRNITITRYIIEDELVPTSPGTFYTVSNRRSLSAISASLNASAFASGTIASSTVPKTYLLVSASIESNPAHFARLRLYSTTGSLTNVTEVSRSFATEPAASTNIIADMILTGSKTTYFTPKIVGANLTNVQNLLTMYGNSSLIAGTSAMYYILQNISGAGPHSITASLHVYSLED